VSFLSEEQTDRMFSSDEQVTTHQGAIDPQEAQLYQVATQVLCELMHITPSAPPTETEVQQALELAKQHLQHSRSQAGALLSAESKTAEFLVLSNLGNIGFQIKVLLKQHSYNTTLMKTQQATFMALQQNNFDAIVIDLALPTPRAGFQVIDALLSIFGAGKMGFPLIVLIPPSSEAEAHQQELFIRGLPYNIIRQENWQSQFSAIVAQLNF